MCTEHGQQVQQGLQFLLLETGLRITNPHSVRVVVRDKDEAASVRLAHGHVCDSLTSKSLQAAEENRGKVHPASGCDLPDAHTRLRTHRAGGL